jgi:replicative DNA helicase
MAKVDALFGNGLRRKEVTFLMGEPGSGKSALMATWAHRVALTEGIGQVLYVSKEMDTQAIMFRLYAAMSGVSSTLFDQWQERRYKGETLDEAEQRQYDAFVDAFNTIDMLGEQYRLHTLDLEHHPRITPEMIAAEVRAINAAAGEEKERRVALVIVDYLQILDYPRGKGFNESTELETVAYTLKNLAMSEGCHIICASSMNRDTSASGLNRMRNSGGIGFAADNVLSLQGHGGLDFPDKLKHYRGATIVSAYTEKMRNGRQGAAILLKFNAAIQHMTDVADREETKMLYDLIHEKDHAKEEKRGGR